MRRFLLQGTTLHATIDFLTSESGVVTVATIIILLWIGYHFDHVKIKIKNITIKIRKGNKKPRINV
jgi:hypothetical protein